MGQNWAPSMILSYSSIIYIYIYVALATTKYNPNLQGALIAMPQKKSLRCISWKWGSLVGKTMEIQVFLGGVGHTSQLLEAGEPKLRSLPCMGATRRLQRALSQRRRPKALLKNILMIRAWTHTMFLIFDGLEPMSTNTTILCVPMWLPTHTR